MIHYMSDTCKNNWEIDIEKKIYSIKTFCVISADWDRPNRKFLITSHLFDIDVDECAENRDRCRNGQCTNTQGGYFCTCNEGYELTPDKSTCVGKYMYFIH